jgi:hypothetical protein
MISLQLITVNTCRQAHASVGGYLCTNPCTFTRKKTFILMTFRSPSDAALILNPNQE